MEKLASCDDIAFPVDLLVMMKRRLENESKTLIPPDHNVPISSSLLVSDQQSISRSQYEIYEQYPLPGLALLSDTFYSSLNRLAQKHLRVPT